MATEAERLVVLMEANTKQFENAMKRVEQKTNAALRGATRSVASLDSQMKTMGATASRVAGMFGFTLGIAGLAQLGRSVAGVVKEAGELVNAADRIGVTTGELQELAYTAKLADVDMSTLTGNMEKFTRSLGDAAQGTGELKDLLAANNVALKNADGSARPVSEMLAEIADLMQNAASAQDKMNIAVMAFGKGGADMVNVLAGGSGALREMADEANATGLVIDDELLRKAEEVGDEWDKMGMRIETNFRIMSLSSISWIDKAMLKMRDVQGAIDGWAWNNLGIKGETPRWMPEGMNFARASRPVPADGGATIIPPPKGGAGKSDADIAKEKIEATLKALEDQATMLGMTERAQFIYNEQLRAGVEENTVMGDKVAAAAAAVYDQKEALEAAAEASAFFAEQAYDAFSALIPKVESGNAVLDKFLNTLIETVLQSALLGQGPLAGLFGTTSATGGIGGILGSIFSGFFADGGVIPSGKVGIVGEKGPEIIRGPAAITPMSAANSNGGTSNVNIVVDVRGATGNREIETIVNRGVAGALAQYDKAQGRRRLQAG